MIVLCINISREWRDYTEWVEIFLLCKTRMTRTLASDFEGMIGSKITLLLSTNRKWTQEIMIFRQLFMIPKRKEINQMSSMFILAFSLEAISGWGCGKENQERDQHICYVEKAKISFGENFNSLALWVRI